MKIHVSPPKHKDLFYHEAQTARKARYIISGLQLLSGATALIGLRLYFSDWLNDLPAWATYAVMAALAFVLIAPGEMGIRETWAYIFRALLNRYNKGLNLFSVILMGFVAVFLTSYSFYLSQFATRNSMKRAAPKVELQDTRQVSESYQQEMTRIATDYEVKKNDVNQRYQGLVNAENAYYDNQIQANEARIDQYRKKEWTTGQRYSSRINALESTNLKLETQRAESLKNLQEQQNAELAALGSWREAAEQEAREEKNAARTDIQDLNQTLQEENQAFAAMFSTLIARFAAWSVILVILFTGYLEVFYFKTGIKRVVRFNSNDFQAPVLVELFAFPYVYFSRHMTNFVRSRYHTLPDLMPPPGAEELEEAIRSEPTEPAPRENAPRNPGARRFGFGPKQKQAEQTRTPKPDPQPEPEPEPRPKEKPVFSRQEPPRPEKPAPPKAAPKKTSQTNLFGQEDVEPKAEPARFDISAAFKPADQSEAAPAGFSDDAGPTIKHVDRRTGQIQYFTNADLDDLLEEYARKIDDASEMYHDTGDPVYLALIEEHRSAMSYWQSRKVELVQKMGREGVF